jgi:hypothetical protein
MWKHFRLKLRDSPTRDAAYEGSLRLWKEPTTFPILKQAKTEYPKLQSPLIRLLRDGTSLQFRPTISANVEAVPTDWANHLALSHRREARRRRNHFERLGRKSPPKPRVAALTFCFQAPKLRGFNLSNGCNIPTALSVLRIISVLQGACVSFRSHSALQRSLLGTGKARWSVTVFPLKSALTSAHRGPNPRAPS